MTGAAPAIDERLARRLIDAQFPQWAAARRVWDDAVAAPAWAGGRGWALWKALITLAGAGRRAAPAHRTLDAVLADHAGRS